MRVPPLSCWLAGQLCVGGAGWRRDGTMAVTCDPTRVSLCVVFCARISAVSRFQNGYIGLVELQRTLAGCFELSESPFASNPPSTTSILVGTLAATEAADARRAAEISSSSSTRWSLTGGHVGCTMYTLPVCALSLSLSLSLSISTAGLYPPKGQAQARSLTHQQSRVCVSGRRRRRIAPKLGARVRLERERESFESAA